MTHELDPSREMPTFTLLGGPLHRIGLRLGLVKAPSNTIALGLALGLGLWVVAAVFALAAGQELFSFSLLGAHVRLLLAIPLLFVAESLLDPRVDGFMRVVIRSRILPGQATTALLAGLSRVGRWRDLWIAEAVCLLVAISWYWFAPQMSIPGVDTSLRSGAGQALAAGTWYSMVALTVFRFLMLRWIWRLLLWLYCLWILSRLPLRLLPAHADGAAGLGGLELVHLHFAPLVLAVSAVLSASFAVDIAAGVMAFEAVYSAAAAILVLDAVIFIGPLLLFVPSLWACKVNGVGDYMVLAENYAARFDGKWLRGEPPMETLLGSSDIQSLADLATAVDVVRNMRVVPVSSATLAKLAAVSLLPLAPLVLFKIPLAELAAQLIARLTGG